MTCLLEATCELMQDGEGSWCGCMRHCKLVCTGACTLEAPGAARMRLKSCPVMLPNCTPTTVISDAPWCSTELAEVDRKGEMTWEDIVGRWITGDSFWVFDSLISLRH